MRKKKKGKIDTKSAAEDLTDLGCLIMMAAAAIWFMVFMCGLAGIGN